MYLGLGSNVGDREAHLADGLRGLRHLGRLTGVSGVYETEPQGYTQQGPFLNLVARLDTRLSPRALLTAIREMEESSGRIRTFRNAPRTLDIDILLFGDRTVDERGLSIPHPRLKGRAFVLVPLVEVESGVVEPGTGRPYREYLAGLASSDRHDPHPAVRRIMDGEELLDEGKA